MGGRPHIAVVGCGIAGTAAALMLRRGGRRVSLFEQSDRVGPVGAGILLQPSGQRVLHGLGLLHQLRTRAAEINEIRAFTAAGRELVRLDYRRSPGGAVALGVHRGDLFGRLHEALVADGVQLRLGSAIERFSQDAASVHLIDRLGRRHGPFDLLVAADGSRSALRRRSGLPAFEHEYSHAALWAVGQCDAVAGRLLQVADRTTRLCGLLPMGGGRCSLFWGLRKQDHAPLLAGGFGRWREQVRQFAPQSDEIFRTVTSFEHTRFTTFRHVWMPRWHDRRVVFIGDAAHATSPHLGQGVNLALQDADTLSNAIDRCENDLPAAVAAHDRARRRAQAYYSAVTYLLSPFFQSDWALLARPRNLVLPWLARLPLARSVMLRTLAG